ncbi:MAG TPA: FtsQ-type POTRA domain-containing protein [Thermomicrobiales bacterium]
MANTETRRRSGATPVAGRDKKSAAAARPAPRRAPARRVSGAQAIAAKPTAKRADRFHALWASGQLAALLGALLCGGTVAYLLTAGSLQIRRVDLAGAVLTPQDTITTALGVSGHNIFTVEPQVAAARLVTLPTVHEVQIWGELPDRLVVRLVERQPALIWQLGEERYLLDNGGFVIAKNPPVETSQTLPQIVVREGDSPTVGGRVDTTVLQAALTIGRRASEYGVTVGKIEYAPTTGLTIITPGSAGAGGGRSIVVGGSARLEEKLSVAGEIIRTEQSWSILNVTDPDRPFFPAKQP